MYNRRLFLKDDDNCLIMAILQFESLGMTEFRFDSIHQKTVFENEPNRMDKYVRAVCIHESIFTQNSLKDIYGGV